MGNDYYTIAMEIKSETYFGRGIFLIDIFVIAVYWFIFSNFESLVSDVLVMPYNIVNILIPLILTRKSSRNPDKRIGESLIYYILSLRDTGYHYMERSTEENEITFIEERK